MMTYQQDPDVVRWGLNQLVDVCSFPSSGACGSSVTQYERDLSHVERVKEGYAEAEHANVENDEIIAHMLQEELSRVAAAEASGSSHVEEENLQASVLAQDWTASKRNLTYGHENTEEEADVNNSQNSVDLGALLEINDEYGLDGEVGKRLNQMIPIPHVPKINGAIPSADEEISDHQRLLDRLQVYDLVELKVQGDGNCQFCSLSDQFYRSPSYHKFVREQVIDQLKSHPEMYEGYVPMAYADYLKKMSRSGEWGDHVTLQAAADSYGVKVFVLTSFKDTCYIEILPHVQKSTRIVFLSFWAEVHYNSIYPVGDLPELESRKKKKWWMF